MNGCELYCAGIYMDETLRKALDISRPGDGIMSETTKYTEEIDRLRAANADLLAALRQAETGLAVAGSYRSPDQKHIQCGLDAAREAIRKAEVA